LNRTDWYDKASAYLGSQRRKAFLGESSPPELRYLRNGKEEFLKPYRVAFFFQPKQSN
jgi:hypothetical protein